MSNLNDILSHSACLSQGQLLQYLNNTLEQEEIRIVEEHVGDCMFCSDAFDGLSTLTQTEITALLSEIKSNTETKIDEHLNAIQEEDERKLIATQGGKGRKSWVAAAAILLLMFGGGAALFSYFNDHHQQEIQLAQNNKKAQPISQEKATIKEGSKELNTISMDQPDLLEMEAEEIVATNDSKEYKKNTQPPLVEKVTEDNKALPAQAPRLLEKRRDVSAPMAKNTTVGSSLGQDLDQKEKAVQKKRKQEVVAKVDDQAAKDFSSMNTATMPKYQGKLKTTPQQNNIYIDKKAGDKENNTRSLAEITQEGQSAYGKKQSTLTNYQQGYALYQQAEYKKSIRYFKKALRKKNVNNPAEIKYYLALALQKIGKEKEADDLLAELEKGTQFKESARRARRSNSR